MAADQRSAIDPALVADCVHCGFCLPTCPTWSLWGEEMDSPRGRIHLMAGLIDGTIPLTDTVVTHFDRCLGCDACVTSCPSGVQYGTLIEQTRGLIEETHERGLFDEARRSLLLAALTRPWVLRAGLVLAPLGRKLPLPGPLRPLGELAPPWRVRRQGPAALAALGAPRARVGLLSGCVQSVVFGDVNAATARVLAADGYDVVVPELPCCGALHAHSGRLEQARARSRRAIEAFEQAAVDLIAVNAAGCGSHLRDIDRLFVGDPAWHARAEAIAAKVRDVSELLADPIGYRARRHPLELRVAFQDSCHLAHAQGIRDAPRAMLAAIPGLVLTEPAEQAICCGSAGLYNLVQPAAARALGDRKAATVLAADPDVYASGNPGCLLQVSTALRRAGRPLPALHPVELLDASIRALPAEAVTALARR